MQEYGYTNEKHSEFLERAKKERLTQKKTVLIVFTLLMTISAGSWLVYQDKKHDYQYAQEAFYDGQVDGFSSSCEELFANLSPNGILYAYGETYTTQWCKSLFNLSELGEEYPPTIDFDGYPQPDKQYVLGFYEASYKMPKIVFTKVPFLCYGNTCVNIASYEPLREVDPSLPNAIKYGVTN